MEFIEFVGPSNAGYTLGGALPTAGLPTAGRSARPWQADATGAVLTRVPALVVGLAPLPTHCPTQHAGCLEGRVDRARLTEIFDQGWGVASDDAAARGRVMWLSIGTKPMMRSFDAMVEQNGYPMPRHALLQYK